MKTKPITHTWSTEQPRSTSAEQEDSASQSCQLSRSQWGWGFQFCSKRWSQCWDCNSYLQWYHQNSHFFFRKHLVISLLSMCPYSCNNYQKETSTKQQTHSCLRKRLWWNCWVTALITWVVGHGRPGKIHDVSRDDRGLQETRAGVHWKDKQIYIDRYRKPFYNQSQSY